MNGEPLLVGEHLTLRFGGVKAMDDVSFTLREGELLAIIGPNGAGKTSIFNSICGVYRPQEGSLTFAGAPLRGGPRDAAERGIARTFQNLGLFPHLTVIDNLMLGRHLRMRTGFVAGALWWGRARAEERAHREQVEEIVTLLDLGAHRATPAAVLPYGLQKRIELGRALAMEPRVLLLDEPVAGMNAEERAEMGQHVSEARRRLNLSVIVVEHDMGFVMGLAERVVAVDFGRVIATGTPAEVQRDEKVIAAYLGTEEVT